VALLAACAAAVLGANARAQAPGSSPDAAAAPGDPASPSKSVYGKLLSIDATRGNVVMEEQDGSKLQWHFEQRVIEEAERFKPGDPLIVIYRQTGPTPKEKRVTALAFPGSAKTPIYHNLTGDRVVIRSAAGVGGRCEQTTGTVSESVIPPGGLAELLDACWCCAPAGGTCTPRTRSGLGKALLAQCF
jgi:hypothetical protein